MRGPPAGSCLSARGSLHQAHLSHLVRASIGAPHLEPPPPRNHRILRPPSDLGALYFTIATRDTSEDGLSRDSRHDGSVNRRLRSSAPSIDGRPTSGRDRHNLRTS